LREAVREDMRFRECDRGLTGIGALIIFIVILLVAALAAAVLIFTGSSLQQRGLGLGGDAGGGGNGVKVISVYGTDGSVGHDLEHFEVIMELAAGSDPINLNRTVVTFDTPTTTQALSYNDTAGDTSNFPETTTHYTVEWIKMGPDHEVGILGRGEKIRVRFNHHDAASGTATTGGIGEDREGEIAVIPYLGFRTPVPFMTPLLIDDKREPIWPSDSIL
jgi:archaellin